MPVVGPRDPGDRFAVLLSSWPAGEAGLSGLRAVLEQQEALLSLARAVFGAGGRLVLPADRTVAPLVAELALDYAAPPQAERREAPVEPVLVAETREPDERLRLNLARLSLRKAVGYVDADGEPVAMQWQREAEETHGFDGEARWAEPRRQPLTLDLIERVHPVGAVVLSPGERALGELEMLLTADIRVAVFAAGQAFRDRFGRFDRTEELLAGVDPEGRRRARAGERERRAPVPYAFLMQRLVSLWGGSGGLPAR